MDYPNNLLNEKNTATIAGKYLGKVFESSVKPKQEKLDNKNKREAKTPKRPDYLLTYELPGGQKHYYVLEITTIDPAQLIRSDRAVIESGAKVLRNPSPFQEELLPNLKDLIVEANEKFQTFSRERDEKGKTCLVLRMTNNGAFGPQNIEVLIDENKNYFSLPDIILVIDVSEKDGDNGQRNEYWVDLAKCDIKIENHDRALKISLD